MKKVFIDGSAGTTGLRIRERLALRTDLAVMTLPENKRKDVAARQEALNACDVAFLCLPDAAAIEAAALVTNPQTVLIDTSTAHRVSADWEYGFPELAGRRARLAAATRIANPGCHASGFIALVEPLVRNGLLARDTPLSAFSLTGYSGGGKKMIADYESAFSDFDFNGEHQDLSATSIANLHLGGRAYALGQMHKHLPEMQKLCELDRAPGFVPVVVPHMSGMEVTVPIFNLDPADVKACYRAYYTTGLVRFVDDPAMSEGGFLSSAAYAGRDTLEISVYGHRDRAVLVARFDNLGKGASGAAIQNMNLVLGCDETKGLVL